MAKRQKFEDVLPWLVGIELFDTFSIESEDDRRILRVVYDNLSPRSFKAGDVIIREGEVGDDFHILIEGSVQVFRDTPSGDTIARRWGRASTFSSGKARFSARTGERRP